MFEQYGDGLMRVLLGVATPEEAIKNAERKDDEIEK